MWRFENGKRDNGTVYVHLPQLKVWSQNPHNRMGNGSDQWHPAPLQRGSWGDPFWQNSKKWVWRRIPFHSNAR